MNMRPAPFLCLLLAFAAQAGNTYTPLGQQGDSHLPLPANGETQRAVLEQFGLPDEEHPPVGTPRMTRWDYRDFSVYFENDRVITSVRHHQPGYPQPPTVQEQP